MDFPRLAFLTILTILANYWEDSRPWVLSRDYVYTVRTILGILLGIAPALALIATGFWLVRRHRRAKQIVEMKDIDKVEVP
ncbi:hypothetical protein E2P81_ATG11168 [Venturia nashicola]|nr:hypothetical protein E2P81_ATG11168 [Venturia nashicola]